jgi:hypothetical protein
VNTTVTTPLEGAPFRGGGPGSGCCDDVNGTPSAVPASLMLAGNPRVVNSLDGRGPQTSCEAKHLGGRFEA